jgi:phytol kinase
MLQSILEALLADLRGALVVGVGILALLVGNELLSRVVKLPSELTRKVSHIGSGFIVLSFPWLLDSAWSVALLTLSFLLILGVGKKTGLLMSIHGVSRRTGGAYFYPVAVLGIWLLSGGDKALFAIPIAIMAIADTGAALVGKARGETQFQVLDGQRSFEGTGTFFGLAFGIVLGGLALAGRPGWPDLLLVSLVAAMLTSAVEAVSVRGSDNILIPYAAWLVLERTLRLGLDELSAWLLGMLVSVLVVLAAYKPARLNPSAALLTFILGTLAYALGGWPWLAPLMVLYGLYALGRPSGLETDLTDVFAASVGSMLVVLLFAHTDDPGLFLPFLVTVSANGAVAAWMALRTRPWLRVLTPVAAAALPPALPLLMGLDVPVLALTAGGLAGLLLFLGLARTRLVGRRLVTSVVVALIAWLLAY